TFQRLGRKPDRLVERGPLRLRAPEHAHMRRADLLRDIQPFAQLDQLLFPQFCGGLRQPSASSDAGNLDALPTRETAQRQQLIIRRAGQPVHRHVDAVRARLDRDAYTIFIRHRLGFERLSVRVSDQARSETRLPRAHARGSSWRPLPRTGVGKCGGSDGGSGSSQKPPTIHRQLSSLERVSAWPKNLAWTTKMLRMSPTLSGRSSGMIASG